jgi:chemotaxis protein histidine kinase CheA
MAFDHSKFIARFVEEAGVHCSRISEGLLNLDKTPADPEVINALFRSAHTIKGSSRMMKITGISELSHKMEDVLDAARAARIPMTSAVSDLLFKGVDALVAMLEKVKAGDTLTGAPDDLCQELSQAALAVPVTERAAPQDAPSPALAKSADLPVRSPSGAATIVAAVPDANSAVPAIEQATQVSPVVPAPPAAPARPVAAAVPQPAPVKGRQADYLRVHADKLDELIHLMGEIVSEHGRSRRQLGRLAEIERQTARHLLAVTKRLETDEPQDTALIETSAALQNSLRQTVRAMLDASLMRDHLVADLQETSLRMRMQPLSTVFDPLRRTVRDLAHEYGKEIDFVVDGGETELDRKIIDRIGDSLLHLIRNSLDHGLESTEERLAAGKPATGNITLSAFYDSGCVIISLADDGKGIAVEKVREKALAKRLFEPEILAAMSRAEVIDLIFLPGFSTSPIITDLSGRGVGMDVVRKNIVDELRGTIVVQTTEEAGTTLFLRLPLHLAVFPLFLFSTSGKICAIPKVSLVEMLSIEQSEIIEIVNKRAIRLREQIIPVENLGAILKLQHDTAVKDGEVLMVIVRHNDDKLGLIVDDILGSEDMVVKPLPSHLRKLRLVSGVTIGEQDSIINVLHVPELLRQARELTGQVRTVQPIREERQQTILVVDDSINTREIEKSVLEAYGYLVELAEDGEDGWEKTRATLYDLVITDVEMPRLDGFSFTERLRADEQYGQVPVIIVTSREKDEDKRRGIQVGANAYIVKGAFDQSNLIETVRSLIG